MPTPKERFADIVAPRNPLSDVTPRTQSILAGTKEGSLPDSNLYRHIEEKSDITNQKIDKLLNIVNTSFARLEEMSQNRLESASFAYHNNTLNTTP